MLELLALLLPVAAASGWFAAYRHFSKTDSSQNYRIDQAYFQGMNHLLNEQHDKAIDSFIKLLEVDSATVEIHFTLGKLYRRQGEVDRSIRIHQNLIARPSLNKAQRARALFELGMDYVKAGLLDRAENLFEELSEEAVFKQSAQEQLLVIYQDEKEWQKAIGCVEYLKKNKKQDWKVPLSHFYCELALESFSKNNIERASVCLNKALSIDSDCIRADLLLADFEFKSGEYQAALKSYQKAIEKDSSYLSETLDPVMNCFEKLGLIDEQIRYLQENSLKYTEERVAFRYGKVISRQGGAKKAFEFLMEKIAQKPSVNGLIELLEVEDRLQSNISNNTSAICRIAEELRQDRNYRCCECGFQAKELHWQCPACKRWAKMKQA